MTTEFELNEVDIDEITDEQYLKMKSFIEQYIRVGTMYTEYFKAVVNSKEQLNTPEVSPKLQEKFEFAKIYSCKRCEETEMEDTSFYDDEQTPAFHVLIYHPDSLE